jgi:hypothetical protein
MDEHFFSAQFVVPDRNCAKPVRLELREIELPAKHRRRERSVRLLDMRPFSHRPRICGTWVFFELMKLTDAISDPVA